MHEHNVIFPTHLHSKQGGPSGPIEHLVFVRLLRAGGGGGIRGSCPSQQLRPNEGFEIGVANAHKGRKDDISKTSTAFRSERLPPAGS